MFNDMIVVVEDLRNVEFNLILVDKRSKFRLKNKSSGSSSNSNNGSSGSNNNFSQQSQQKSSPSVPILEYHSFPLPRITGSRSSLKVSQGVIPYIGIYIQQGVLCMANVKKLCYLIIRSFHEIFVLFSDTQIFFPSKTSTTIFFISDSLYYIIGNVKKLFLIDVNTLGTFSQIPPLINYTIFYQFYCV